MSASATASTVILNRVYGTNGIIVASTDTLVTDNHCFGTVGSVTGIGGVSGIATNNGVVVNVSGMTKANNFNIAPAIY